MTPHSTSPTPPPAPEASARRYMRSRLFARLFLVALPGLIGVIVVGLVALFAFGQLGSQTSGLSNTLHADATVDQLIIHMDDLTTSLDLLIGAGSQYNSVMLDQSLGKISRDLVELDQTDLNFPGSQQSEVVSLKTSTRQLIGDLRQLNSASPAQRNPLWQNQLRPRLMSQQTALTNLTREWDDETNKRIDNAANIFQFGQAGIIAIAL